MRVSEFHFDLPEQLIAQHPPEVRGSSRMLVYQRRPLPEDAGITDALFTELPRYLRQGDLLVLNDSRVLPSRLFAIRAGASTQPSSPAPSGKVEVLLTEQIEGDLWRALCRPAKKVHPGERLLFFDPGTPADAGPVLTAEVVELGCFGERTLRFAPTPDFYEIVSRIGHMPLPPYIHRDQAHEPDTEEDRDRYQTVYAQDARVQPPGSAAAPTAGLHFTPEVLAALEARGVEIARLTLHVGLGTFQPVRVEELADIRLHAERYTLPAATADALNRALAEGRRIVAVGTTTTRTLEHVAAQAAVAQGAETPLRVEPHAGATSIFLAPGHHFRIVSGLLTNFHLPESTLLMLVAGFAANVPGAQGEIEVDPARGLGSVLTAYRHAVEQQYRFFSYGDCMLLL